MNEFYLLNGDKFSASSKNAIWGKDILSPQTVDGVRFYLARSRPEGRRVNFTPGEYETVITDTLIGTWQRWLNELGARVDKLYGGQAPDSGIWPREHTAFLGQLENRLAAMANCLGEDGFSLNLAAGTLEGIVADTVRFSAREAALADAADCGDESRTTIALELAAAKLLACCAAPLMPRFAARLAAALGMEPPANWPRIVTLLPPGTPVNLSQQIFFGVPAWAQR